MAGRHAAEVAVQAELLLGGVERAPRLQPVVHRLFAGEDRGAGQPGVGAAGHGGAELGEFAVAFGLQRVVGFALGDDLGLELGELLGGWFALLGGGALQDLVAGGAGVGPSLSEVVDEGHGPSFLVHQVCGEG